MLKLITTTAKYTNTRRILINRVGTKQVNWEKASGLVKDFFEKSPNQKTSKCIFKRAWAWVKEFVSNFKKIKEYIKNEINAQKEALGKNFTKKEANETRKSIFGQIKEHINNIKAEIESITKQKKATNSPKTKNGAKAEKPKTPKTKNSTKAEAPATTETPVKAEAPVATSVEAPTTNATPSFAGRSIKRIPLAELKEMAKAQGASEEMLNGVRTKAEVIKIIETLKAGS